MERILKLIEGPVTRLATLDERSDVIEVEAHVRHIRRPAYTRHPGCTCEDTPVIFYCLV